MASIVTIQPESANCCKSSGIAVISLDFSSVATCAHTRRFSTAHARDPLQRLLACCLIMRASARLAIDGDHSFNSATEPLHPRDKTGFKLLGIDVSKHASKGVMRRNTIG